MARTSALSTARVSEIEKMSRPQRRAAKAEEYATRVVGSVTVEGFTVSCESATVVDGVVDCQGVRVTRDGKPVPVDPHWRVVNPPLLRHDPAGQIVRRSRDEEVRLSPVDPLVVLATNVVEHLGRQ